MQQRMHANRTFLEKLTTRNEHNYDEQNIYTNGVVFHMIGPSA